MILLGQSQTSNVSMNPIHSIYNREYSGKFFKEKWITQRLLYASNLYSRQLLAHFGCVNAIEFSANGNYLVSGGDDRRVLIWSLSKCIFNEYEEDAEKVVKPAVMTSHHLSNIFCLKIDSTNEKIFSGGNDDQVLLHDVLSRQCVNIYSHEKPVYCITLHPTNRNLFATAGEDGRILIYDVRNCSRDDGVCLARMRTPFFSTEYNPANEYFMATANSKGGICVWDTRTPKKVYATFGNSADNGMSVCYSQDGKKILALRRRQPPILYRTDNDQVQCEFSHPNYYNSCTMKSCSFAGQDDEYVTSGSDDFNLYFWKIPENESVKNSKITHMILKGHRSIVNQVRYCKNNAIIASSGVEKVIQLWSPYQIGKCKGSLSDSNTKSTRNVYSQQEYLGLVQSSRDFMPHDYSGQSTTEDPLMLAFFDSLIERDRSGWNASSTDSSVDSDTTLDSFSNSSDSSSDDSENNRVISKRLELLLIMKRRRLHKNRTRRLLAQKRLSQSTPLLNMSKRLKPPTMKKMRTFRNNIHIKVPITTKFHQKIRTSNTFRPKSATKTQISNSGVYDGPSTSTGIPRDSSPNPECKKRQKHYQKPQQKILKLYDSSESETDSITESEKKPIHSETNKSESKSQSLFKKRTVKATLKYRQPIVITDSDSDSD